MAQPKASIIFHEITLQHQTGRGHPECAERLEAIREHLRQTGLWQDGRIIESRPATIDELCRVHRPSFVDWVKHAAESGEGSGSFDTVIMRQSYEAARYAAGAGIVGADLVMQNGGRAFCCVRPPGHHATQDVAQGFCLFNNVAVAARHLQRRHGIRRIAIVDWDVHHGNGTQDIFYGDPSVFYFSMHRYPWYPGTGRTSENGSGYTLNIPLPYGTSAEEYLERYRRAIRRIAEEYRPEFVLISAGFDSHQDDPIGGLSLQAQHYGEMTRELIHQTAPTAGGRVLSMLEGGYNLSALPRCVEEHLLGMVDS